MKKTPVFHKAAILYLTAVSILYILMIWFTPLQCDDLVFRAAFRQSTDGTFSIRSFFEFWKTVRLTDNGRLSNMLSPWVSASAVNKDIYAVATGLAATGVVVMISYFSFGIKYCGSLWRLALIWVSVMALLPWRNGLFIVAFSLNYIWAALLTLGFIAVALKLKRSPGNILTLFICVLLAVIAGGWHEGFAFTTLFGFICMAAVRKFRLPASLWIIGVVYASSAFLFFLSPGSFLRAGAAMGNSGMVSVTHFISDYAPILILFALIMVKSCWPKGRKDLLKTCLTDRFVVFIGIAVSGLLLGVTMSGESRGAFWPDIAAIVCIYQILSNVAVAPNVLKYIKVPAVVSSAVFFGVFISAIVWQYRYMVESEQIMKDIEESASGTVFYDIMKPSDLPLYTFKYPSQSTWVEQFQYRVLREDTGKPFVAVVPTSLRNVYLEDAQDLDSDQGIKRYGSSLIAPYDLETATDKYPAIIPLDYSMTDGSHIISNTLILPYSVASGLPKMSDIQLYLRPANIKETDIRRVLSVTVGK